MIYTIGEALIDCIHNGDNIIYSVGGAPANVAMCCAKLGIESKFIGKIGNDNYGDKIIEVLKSNNVSLDYVYRTSLYPTCLVNVNLTNNHERNFVSKTPLSSDFFLEINEVKDISFSNQDILHFCSVDLMPYSVEKATEFCIKNAKNNNCIISFDPNVRLTFWHDDNKCKETILKYFNMVDIVKISDEDASFLFPNKDFDQLSQILFAKGVKLVIITLGKDGSIAYFKNKKIKQNAFDTKIVDTTGAGDIFIGTFLSCLHQNKEDIKRALLYASSASSFICSHFGVGTNLPTINDIQNIIKNGT